jgi:hypothetical protein
MPRLGLYQPFIEDRNVRRLYHLKLEHHRRTGKKAPMTALINRILDDFFGAEELDTVSEASAAQHVLPDTLHGPSP